MKTRVPSKITITGTSGDDTLIGTIDPDTIHGLAGNDTLIGGGGADTLIGGADNDVYRVEDAGDFVLEDVGGGFDSVYVALNLASYALAAGSEVELLSAIDSSSAGAMDLTGNEFANTIIGTAGANTLIGGGGADVLAGNGGNDVYRVEEAGDVVLEYGGGGFDSVYAVTSYALRAGSEVELLSAIDTSSAGAMDLTGNEFANTIIGTAGANTLIGGGGADVLAGNGGNDVYRVEEAGDVVLEYGGGGFDSVYAVTSYALRAGSEVELLSAIDSSSAGAMDLTGNEFANTIIGTAGANTLIGGGGADVLAGNGGNDVYRVEEAGDVVLENAGAGSDSVYAVTSYTLAAGSEVELLSAIDTSSAGAMDLTGNEFANTIIGTAGANTLSGGGGADYLVGGAGHDRFLFNTALGGGNIDVIADLEGGGLDKIILAGGAGEPFAALAAGQLASNTFVVGTAALDANDYLIYNSATGALLYDADGNGAGAAVQFATISAGLGGLNSGLFEVSGPANSAPTVTSGGTASLPENSPASTIVYQAAATDANGDRITYSLAGADAALLTIDAVSGAVRLISPADFETKSAYSFSVLASDSGSSTARAVTLTITDVADVASPIINETTAPNDATTSAQAIDRGTFVIAANPNLPDDDLPSATIRGDLPNSTDKDFFSITLQAGEKLILDVDNSGGNLDSHIRVYGSNGVEIGNNDDQGSPDPGSDPHPTYGHNTDSFFSFRAPTSGTYFFSIESFQDAANPTFGSYDINVSIGPPASAQQLIEEDIDALVSGSKWTDTDLTFGFPTLASQYPDSFDEANPDAEFQPFSAAQQAATRQLLQLVGNVSSLTFTEMTATPGQADLRYAMSTDDDVEAAHAYYPSNGGPSSPGGSAWFNTTSFNNPLKGNYAWMGILHETGHALGLKHGHEAPAIRPERDSVEYTVMTYRSYVGDDAEGYNNALFGFPQTLMMYDIAALQRIYGANFAHNSGNSIYTWSPTSGEMFINGTGQGAPGDGVSAQANRVFQTIWDGGGIDTYDLSNYSANGNSSTIDLRPGEWTTTDGIQLAGLGGGNVARGNVANALMYQGNTASLIENAIGSGDADTIIANQAANQLTGGGGNDVFRWAAGTDAGTGALADTITDLARGNDQINLVDVDAKSGTGENDAFTFIATSAFSSVAGELRYQVEGGNVRIQADLDGNGLADMEIVVNNNTILAASDFVF